MTISFENIDSKTSLFRAFNILKKIDDLDSTIVEFGLNKGIRVYRASQCSIAVSVVGCNYLFFDSSTIKGTFVFICDDKESQHPFPRRVRIIDGDTLELLQACFDQFPEGECDEEDEDLIAIKAFREKQKDIKQKPVSKLRIVK